MSSEIDNSFSRAGAAFKSVIPGVPLGTRRPDPNGGLLFKKFVRSAPVRGNDGAGLWNHSHTTISSVMLAQLAEGNQLIRVGQIARPNGQSNQLNSGQPSLHEILSLGDSDNHDNNKNGTARVMTETRGPARVKGMAPKMLRVEKDVPEVTDIDIPAPFSSLLSMWIHTAIEGKLTGDERAYDNFEGMPLQSPELMRIYKQRPEIFRRYKDLISIVSDEAVEALREKTGKSEAYFTEVPLRATKKQADAAEYINNRIQNGRLSRRTVLRYIANPTDFDHENEEGFPKIGKKIKKNLRLIRTWSFDAKRGRFDRPTTELDIVKLAWEKTPANQDMDELISALSPLMHKFLFNFDKVQNITVRFKGQEMGAIDAMRMLLDKVASGEVTMSLYDIKGNMNGHSKTETPDYHNEIPVFYAKDMRSDHFDDIVAGVLPVLQFAGHIVDDPQKLRELVKRVHVGIVEVNFRIVPHNSRVIGRPDVHELLVPDSTPVVVYHVNGTSILLDLDKRNEKLDKWWEVENKKSSKEHKKALKRQRKRNRKFIERHIRYIGVVERSGYRLLVENYGGKHRVIHEEPIATGEGSPSQPQRKPQVGDQTSFGKIVDFYESEDGMQIIGYEMPFNN